MNDTGVIIAYITAGGSVIGALALYLGTRGKTNAEATTALAALVNGQVKEELERLYKRIEALEEVSSKKMAAVARIFRAIQRQWPDSHGPDLDPADLQLIDDVAPPAWFRKAEKEREHLSEH